MTLDETGPKPTNSSVLEVLYLAWIGGGLFTKGDLCRRDANIVAAAASRGWITTQVCPEGRYGRKWLITPTGLEHLWQMKGFET